MAQNTNKSSAASGFGQIASFIVNPIPSLLGLLALESEEREQIGKDIYGAISAGEEGLSDAVGSIQNVVSDVSRGLDANDFMDQMPADYQESDWRKLGPEGRQRELDLRARTAQALDQNVSLLGYAGFQQPRDQAELQQDVSFLRSQGQLPSYGPTQQQNGLISANLTNPNLFNIAPVISGQSSASNTTRTPESMLSPMITSDKVEGEAPLFPFQRGFEINQLGRAAEGATVTREPVLDADGNPVRGPRQPVLNENGEPVTGPDGQPLTREGDIVTRAVVTGGGQPTGLLAPDIFASPEGQKALGITQAYTGEKDTGDKGFLSGFGKRAQGILKRLGVAQEENPEGFDRLAMALSGMSTSPNIGLQQSILQDQRDRAELNRAVLEQLSTAGDTPFTRQAAADFAEWAGGGEAQLRSNIGQMEFYIDQLGRTNDASGPVIGMLPEFIKQAFPSLAEGSSIRQGIEQVAQNNLRRILGGQFTQREGEMLLSRVFNPYAQEEYNIQRAQRLLETLREQYTQKQAAYEYYLNNGTIEGFRAGVGSLADLENQFADELWAVAGSNTQRPDFVTEAQWAAMTDQERSIF